MTDANRPAPDPANWTCQIGESPRGGLPPGSDLPMRKAIAEAYKELTGRDPDYIFSGWGSPLPETYRAVHEDRLPDPEVAVVELSEGNWHLSDAMLMERQFRLVLQPRPRWLPEWMWWRVLRRLLVIEERR